MKLNIRLLYLYLFSAVGLIITVIGFVRIIELAINVYVFKGSDVYSYTRPYVYEPLTENVSSEAAKVADEKNAQASLDEANRQRQRDTAGALSMILVGGPLYFYHWKTIQKDHKNSKNK